MTKKPLGENNAVAKPENGHWLVAAWPGMANVAVIAAGYLLQSLASQKDEGAPESGVGAAEELAGAGHFDIESVSVKDGVVGTPHMPRSLLYSIPARGQSPRLTVFMGEAQPSVGAHEFAHELLDRATQIGGKIDQVVTFASMGSQLHPSQQPRVFGAATETGGEEQIDRLRRLEVQLLKEGQIAGLNGVLLGAASERGIRGLCLLGEIPFYAAQVPNPKAAKAVLDAFSLMSGIEIDMKELGRHAERIDRLLLRILERAEQRAEEQESREAMGLPPEDAPDEPAETRRPGRASHAAKPGGAEPPSLDVASRKKIERMFEEARGDPSRPLALKQELDRLGVFPQYENRFLDLFKRAE